VAEASGDGEVYFEIVGIGRNLKVTAIDAATGVEVVVIVPATASHADLRQLALRKLMAKIAAGGPPDP
jgi:uncharacterized protein DUF6898